MKLLRGRGVFVEETGTLMTPDSHDDRSITESERRGTSPLIFKWRCWAFWMVWCPFGKRVSLGKNVPRRIRQCWNTRIYIKWLSRGSRRIYCIVVINVIIAIIMIMRCSRFLGCGFQIIDELLVSLVQEFTRLLPLLRSEMFGSLPRQFLFRKWSVAH